MRATRLTSSVPAVDLSQLPDFEAQIECQLCTEEGRSEPAIAWVRATCQTCGEDNSATLGKRCIQIVLDAIAEDDSLDCQRCAGMIFFAQHTRIVYF